MSTLKTNAAQIGQSVTATNNFTLYQPTTPDGTVRLGIGNAGSTSDMLIAKSDGSVRTIQQTAGTVGSNYVVKEIEQFQMGGNSITDEYLLLVPNPDGFSPAYQIMGEFYSSRGSTDSGNSYAVDEINVGRAHNARYGNIQTRAGSSTCSFVRLHYVTYNGVKWIAAKARSGGGPAHNGIFFRGWILNEQADTFRKVRSSQLTNITNMYVVGSGSNAGSSGFAPMTASGFFSGVNNNFSIPIDPSYGHATVYIRARHDSQAANGYVSMMSSDSSLYVTENNTFTIRRGVTGYPATGNLNYCKLNEGSYTIDAGLDWSGVFTVNQNLGSRSSVLIDFNYTHNNIGAARTTGSMQYAATAPCYGLNFDWDGSTVTPNLWAEYVVVYNRITEGG